MDTADKLKTILNYCNYTNCKKCPLSSTDCRYGTIINAVTDMYSLLNGSKDLPSVSSEDGTAARATHYLACPIQPIDLIQYTLTKEELIGFLKGNIIKYSLRAGHKGDPEKDKAKALQYKKWLDTVLVGDLITV